MIKRGDIYLVDFGNSKNSFSFGKNRPVIVFQTNKLNYAISENIYEYVLVIPLSTKDDIVTNEFRYKLQKRENLKKDSYAVCNSICFLHINNFKEKIASLNKKEVEELENILKNVFDIKD